MDLKRKEEIRVQVPEKLKKELLKAAKTNARSLSSECLIRLVCSVIEKNVKEKKTKGLEF